MRCSLGSNDEPLGGPPQDMTGFVRNDDGLWMRALKKKVPWLRIAVHIVALGAVSIWLFK